MGLAAQVNGANTICLRRHVIRGAVRRLGLDGHAIELLLAFLLQNGKVLHVLVHVALLAEALQLLRVHAAGRQVPG